MKSIPLRDETPFETREVIKAVASQPSPGQGINAMEMRQRCRLIDALEVAGGEYLMLEDADHALLVRLINAFQFGTAHPKLLAVIDDVLHARIPDDALAPGIAES
jgi:hypothetical protein